MKEIVYNLYKKKCEHVVKIDNTKKCANKIDGGGGHLIVYNNLSTMFHFGYEQHYERCNKLKLLCLFFLNLLKTTFRIIITKGKLKLYLLFDGKKVIHSSYVYGKCYRFSFMKEGDIQIGPCWTHEDYRGRGIYPFVLKQILENELNIDKSAWMYIRLENLSSQRGVAKVGFKEVGKLELAKWHTFREVIK